MRRRTMRGGLAIAALAAASFLLGACASSGKSNAGSEPAPQASQASKASKGMEPPPGHPFAKVKLGMPDTEVTKLIGSPDTSRSYMTGKAFIPFYYGPDTHRSDWIYNGEGRIVFSRNRWNGALKVIRVIYNPSEGGG